MQVRDYTNTYGTVGVLRELTDFVIVLDRGSNYKYNSKQVDLLLREEHNLQWNCQVCRTVLHYYALANHCDWVMLLDQDQLLSPAFLSRENVNRQISMATERGIDIYRPQQRDLWGDHDHWRMDGIWGKKTHWLLSRVWLGDNGITLKDPDETRYHSECFDSSRKPRIESPIGDYNEYVVYHAGCITRQKVEERVAKYHILDSENKCQAMGYDYMLDDDSLKLNLVPSDHRNAFIINPGLTNPKDGV